VIGIKNDSYVIGHSGTHGTGKTTVACQKIVDLKVQYPGKSIRVLCDLESLCPYPINKTGSRRTQAWLFSNQINQELTNLQRFDIVVTDRTVVDVIGYTHALGFHNLAESMQTYAAQHITIYKKIYCKKIISNPYHHADGIREAEDKLFRQDVEDAILTSYDNLMAQNFLTGDIYFV